METLNGKQPLEPTYSEENHYMRGVQVLKGHNLGLIFVAIDEYTQRATRSEKPRNNDMWSIQSRGSKDRVKG